MRDKDTIYRGVRLEPEKRTAGEVQVFVTSATSPKRRLERPLDPGPSQKIYNHSPMGFNWGYPGSGPAQLALAILLDYYGPKSNMWRRYQDFKFKVIARLPQESGWVLRGQDIEAALEEIGT